MPTQLLLIIAANILLGNSLITAKLDTDQDTYLWLSLHLFLCKDPEQKHNMNKTDKNGSYQKLLLLSFGFSSFYFPLNSTSPHTTPLYPTPPHLTPEPLQVFSNHSLQKYIEETPAGIWFWKTKKIHKMWHAGFRHLKWQSTLIGGNRSHVTMVGLYKLINIFLVSHPIPLTSTSAAWMRNSEAYSDSSSRHSGQRKDEEKENTCYQFLLWLHTNQTKSMYWNIIGAQKEEVL